MKKQHSTSRRGTRRSRGNAANRQVVHLGSNRNLVILAFVFCTFALWLFFAVIFGGLGGHVFATLSRAEFLNNSTNTYYESHEAMLAAHNAYKDREREAARLAKLERSGRSEHSRYKDQKSGRLIYEEDARLQELINEIEAELQKQGISADDREEIGRIREELKESKAAKRSEVAALLKRMEWELEKVKAGQIDPARADSDQDIRESQSEDQEQPAKTESQVAARTDTKELELALQNTSPKSGNITVANRVRIDFLDDSCGMLGKKFEPMPVEYRKGSTAIKGSSLDTLDTLVEVARSCGEVQLSVYPTERGLAEDSENDRDLLALRNAEVKYYLLQRRIPKESISLYETLN